jgi:hypothetical protein
VVIDGAKALRRAVLDTFGERALIQRCQAHKKRNVLDSLPERLRASVRTALNQAYATGDPKRAHRLLENLAHKLESAHPGAAASLREGLNETLTVMGLHLSEGLERVLSSTNLIENVFSRVREIAHRVKRWQVGGMSAWLLILRGGGIVIQAARLRLLDHDGIHTRAGLPDGATSESGLRRIEAQLSTASRIASGSSKNEHRTNSCVAARPAATWLDHRVAGLAGTGRVGRLPGLHRAASLLQDQPICIGVNSLCIRVDRERMN